MDLDRFSCICNPLTKYNTIYQTKGKQFLDHKTEMFHSPTLQPLNTDDPWDRSRRSSPYLSRRADQVTIQTASTDSCTADSTTSCGHSFSSPKPKPFKISLFIAYHITSIQLTNDMNPVSPYMNETSPKFIYKTNNSLYC